MDIATIIGILAGIGLVTWAIISGAPLSSFWDQQSVLIVGGGSLAAFLTAFPLRNVLGFAKVAKKVLFAKPANPSTLIKDLVGYAEIARRDGILALENVTQDVKDPFVKTGIQMAVDGTDPELIEQILNTEMASVEERHMEGKSLFDNLGKYAPAYGMIGTLIGLVIMLKNMSDPSSIGDGMAVALLTTLYGSLISNTVFLPLADKLAVRSREELLLKTIVIRGIMSIQSGDNPRVVEQKLWSILPVSGRKSAEDAKAA